MLTKGNARARYFTAHLKKNIQGSWVHDVLYLRREESLASKPAKLISGSIHLNGYNAVSKHESGNRIVVWQSILWYMQKANVSYFDDAMAPG